MVPTERPTALEFFAGGGLVRLGLAGDFDVIWANDIDPMKAAAWQANFGATGFVHADIATLNPATIPKADLAWASFPCQDLSLAGARGGLSARRSGTFFTFADIIKSMQARGTAPHLIVIENVPGLLTSRSGEDYNAVLAALRSLGYHSQTIEIDACHFLPQSRPRVFIIAAFGLSSFAIGEPVLDTNVTLSGIIDHGDQSFWSQPRTQALLASLSARHARKLADIQATGLAHIGTIYRRTRIQAGMKAPVAEVRFDGIAGCLRTPSGGSSRQFLMFVEGQDIKVRALNAREAMRLMGVPDKYVLPNGQLAGLKIAGDGVAVPVVEWLSAHVLVPLMQLQFKDTKKPAGDRRAFDRNCKKI
jgi:DNA (cytosine-5)-methyltransferase 1